MKNNQGAPGASRSVPSSSPKLRGEARAGTAGHGAACAASASDWLGAAGLRAPGTLACRRCLSTGPHRGPREFHACPEVAERFRQCPGGVGDGSKGSPASGRGPSGAQGLPRVKGPETTGARPARAEGTSRRHPGRRGRDAATAGKDP